MRNPGPALSLQRCFGIALHTGQVNLSDGSLVFMPIGYSSGDLDYCVEENSFKLTHCQVPLELTYESPPGIIAL